MHLQDAHSAGPAPMRPAPEPTPRRLWTTREERYLREHYVADGAEDCATALGRSLSSVYQHARALDLHRAPVNEFRQRWSTSDQIDAVIRRAFATDATKGMVDRLAKTVGRPRWWVSKRAVVLGLKAPRFKEPEWTAEETAVLEEHGHRSAQTLRAMLQRRGFMRSETAIVVKMKRLQVDRTDYEHFTASGLAEVMGVDAKTVLRWIEKGMLKAQRRGTARVEAQGGDQWWVNRQDVRRFIIENAAAVDIRKVEKHWFIDLLAHSGRAA